MEAHINSVLLDTSFFIRLLNPGYSEHQNAKDYFKYFLEQRINIKCSTISVAEYCVKGAIEELPLKNVQLMPFNFNHAIVAGKFAGIIFSKRSQLEIKDRKIIPNDTKLLAQAESEPDIDAFVTADTELIKKLYFPLNEENYLSFKIIDIHQPYGECFGILPLKL
ncbi:MAG: hypothetical protein ACD_79C01317G0002 [uncultured bacterium]|nr:MAG: hypothetical protein ACD_79C01317G0002 [uncultured bacterium]